MPRRKLIENAMPVAAINAESEREKYTRVGMPSAVHVWWSRRSMAAARSTLFASLVDDPADHPEIFPTKTEQDCERRRLLKMTEDLSVIENTANKELLEVARKEIEHYVEGPLPTVFDPFVGGGAIPVEAHRLGLSTEAADLNAVAALITTAVSDIPTRFHDSVPVHPEENVQIGIPMPEACGLAEDVRYYGDWMREEAFRRIGNLYPKAHKPDDGQETDVLAWIWARTVKCPNPSCGCDIPLSSSYDLARKKGFEAWVEPVIEDGKISFSMHQGPNTSDRVRPKVAQTAVFKCPVCGEITPDAYVKECGKKHQISSQLIAVVIEDKQKRLYLKPDSEQENAAKIVPPEIVPHGTLPNFPRRFSPPSFGLIDYADLFTNRQLVFITTMMELAGEAQIAIEKCAVEKGYSKDKTSFSQGGQGARAYSEAVRIVLTLTISKLLDRCSNLCSWDASGGGSLRNVFSRAAMPMIWDYAEGNPFADSSGSFAIALLRTCESLAALPIEGSSHTYMADCSQPNDVRDAMLSTDLPYYDKASYADLSDFFYVWLRYGLSDLFPDWFGPEITPKKEELTAFPYRWNGDRLQANAFYEEGLNISFKNLYESVTEQYPSVVAFYYKGNDAGSGLKQSEWEAFITAVCNAGFMITASWPLARKYESSIELAEERGIPITVVIRKKPSDAQQTTRRYFVAAVKRELPSIVDELKSIVGLMDLRASVIGRALSIFSRYDKVLDADGTEMKPQIASRIIEQELDMILSSLYGNETESDAKEEKDNG